MCDSKLLLKTKAVCSRWMVLVLCVSSVPSSGQTVDANLDILWDNGMTPNGFSGRAISPPNFPDIRVADDVTFSSRVTIQDFHANVIQDAGWSDGDGTITLEIREDTGNGPGGIIATHRGEYTAMFLDMQYFGRDDYDYWIEGIDIQLDAGTYWFTIRNEAGTGSGTNYWMTSDGGADGPGSSTGFFSLDGGASWNGEGAGWHHAFQVTGILDLPSGACCIKGECQIETPSECCDLGGSYRGGGSECSDPDICGESTKWCNGLIIEGATPVGVSPPGFLNRDVADDFVIPSPGNSIITDVIFKIEEDAKWLRGETLELTIYNDKDNLPGTVVYTVPDLDFGWTPEKNPEEYTVELCPPANLAPGKYWIGFRNPDGDGPPTSSNDWKVTEGSQVQSNGAVKRVNNGPWENVSPGVIHLGFELLGVPTFGACCRGDECHLTRDDECFFCELPATCDGDVDGDGQVNPVDDGLCQAAFGSVRRQDLCRYDLDCDGQINPVDSGIIQSLFGTCEAQRPPCPGFGVWQGAGTDCEENPCGSP